MEGKSSADRRGGRYHVILCVVIGEMTLSTCLLCRLLKQDENQSPETPSRFYLKSDHDCPPPPPCPEKLPIRNLAKNGDCQMI